MAVEPLEKAIQLWERGEIRTPQAFCKILLWLRQIEVRLRNLEMTKQDSGDRQN